MTADIAVQTPFLETVRDRAGLEDLYDARDITEVVFRTLRDLMTTADSDAVEQELRHGPDGVEGSGSDDLAELWRDTNLLVRFLSRLRPPLDFDGDTFVFRISQEAGLSRGVQPETAIAAVFAATRAELSADRAAAIAEVLPGRVRELWTQAR